MPTSELDASALTRPNDVEPVPIRRVSEMTGVNSVTLRAWERRYGLLKPLRTAKGHRLYRPEDIARVEAIQRWLARGVAVGQVRALLDQQPEPEGELHLGADPWEAHYEALNHAIGSLNPAAIEQRLAALTAEYPLPVVVDQCLEPLISQWRSDAGKARPAYGVLTQQRCFESVLRAYFASLRYRHTPLKSAPGVLLVDNGRHEDPVLPMILASSLAVNRLRVDFFGPVPQAEWLYAVEQRRVDAVLLYADGVPGADLTLVHRDLERQLAVPVWFAGRQIGLLDDALQSHSVGQTHGEIVAAVQARLANRVEGPVSIDRSGNGSTDSGVTR